MSSAVSLAPHAPILSVDIGDVDSSIGDAVGGVGGIDDGGQSQPDSPVSSEETDSSVSSSVSYVSLERGDLSAWKTQQETTEREYTDVQDVEKQDAKAAELQYTIQNNLQAESKETASTCVGQLLVTSPDASNNRDIPNNHSSLNDSPKATDRDSGDTESARQPERARTPPIRGTLQKGSSLNFLLTELDVIQQKEAKEAEKEANIVSEQKSSKLSASRLTRPSSALTHRVSSHLNGQYFNFYCIFNFFFF